MYHAQAREDSSSPASSRSGSAASDKCVSVPPSPLTLSPFRTHCSFYSKIGACRHGVKCSRLHVEPKTSQTVLLRNFYRAVEPFLTPQLLATPDGNREFEAFFYEVFTEIERKYGRVEELKVCENIAEHLIGNVYIKFDSCSVARRAVDDLNRRWFARQPIYAELSPVADFRDACCRQHESGECTRGGFCNFMHVKQPGPRLLGRIHEERLARKRRRHSSSSSDSPEEESDSDFDSSSISSSSSAFSARSDLCDGLPKNYRQESSSSSEADFDSDVSAWDRAESPAAAEDTDSVTPRAFRPLPQESSDDDGMSDSELEMLRRRKQKLRRQRWEELRDELLASLWSEDRERNFVFSLL